MDESIEDNDSTERESCEQCRRDAEMAMEACEQAWTDLENDRARILYEAMATLTFGPGEGTQAPDPMLEDKAVAEQRTNFLVSGYAALARFAESLSPDC